MTLVGAAALAGLLLDWHWDLAILFGALVVVTGPTVIQPLLRDMRLRPRLKTILEAEGVLIDPIGALLAGFILQLVTRPGVRTFASQTAGVVGSIGFGLLAGLAAGFLLAGASAIVCSSRTATRTSSPSPAWCCCSRRATR